MFPFISAETGLDCLNHPSYPRIGQSINRILKIINISLPQSPLTRMYVKARIVLCCAFVSAEILSLSILLYDYSYISLVKRADSCALW